ncbi:MAG: ribbon-helix-helix domain-containing protein [Candidatus Woesearchaeota archaeon]
MYYYSTTKVAQFRIPKGLLKEVDLLVSQGLYPNKSEVIRDAIRKLILERQIGTIPNLENSVNQIKTLRKNLSESIKSFEDIKQINKLN